MEHKNAEEPSPPRWQEKLHTIIFEADTPAGKLFDVVLLWAILLSILTVMLDSVASIQQTYGSALRLVEWFFTILFSIEYILRLLSVRKPLKYATSFFGMIDLLAILPTYISLVVANTQYLMVIRAVRLLRIFRVLKLARYLSESQVLMQALRASKPKITVFLGAVFTLLLIIGSIMFLIEGPDNGFTSLPKSMYWAVVTLTTVGYGDITPQTTVGQTISAVVMILGYGILAVPTGIVSAELSRANTREHLNTIACPECGLTGHDHSAKFCKFCGGRI